MQNTITRMPTPLLQSSWRNTWRLMLIVALLALLTACGAARIGFNNGTTVSYWWLNSYVDFDGEQKPWVKQHINDLFAWHRKTQLRGYAELASRIQRRDLSTVTAAELLADYEDGRARVLTFTDRAAPELADLALSLSGEQIGNIEEKLEKNNAKFRKEYLEGSKEKRQEFRFKKMMKQAEYWFGSFSNEQEVKLRQLSDARPLNNGLVYENRLLRQKALVDLMKKIRTERPSHEETIRLIRAYVTAANDHFGNKSHQDFFDATTKANANLIAQMMHMATPDQRSTFVRTVQDWISDFNRLSAKASS